MKKILLVLLIFVIKVSTAQIEMGSNCPAYPVFRIDTMEQCSPALGGWKHFWSYASPDTGECNQFTAFTNTLVGSLYGLRVTHAHNSNLNQPYRVGGVLGECFLRTQHTGTITDGVGVYGHFKDSASTGYVNKGMGLFSLVSVSNPGGRVNTAYGLETRCENAGNIGAYAGVHVLTPANTGTLGTSYGVIVEPQTTAGVKYAYYSAGPLDRSLLEGNLLVNDYILTDSIISSDFRGANYIGATASYSASLQTRSITVGPADVDMIFQLTTGGTATGNYVFKGGNNGSVEYMRLYDNTNTKLDLKNNFTIRGLNSAGTTRRTLFQWTAGDNINITGEPGVTDINLNPTNGGPGLIIKGSTGNVAMGLASPAARLHLVRTSEQFRYGYDVNNYLSHTTSSTGVTTIAAAGTDPSLKILNSPAHKLSFFNATPVVQQGTGAAGSTFSSVGGTALQSNDTFGGYTIAQVVAILKLYGLLQ